MCESITHTYTDTHMCVRTCRHITHMHRAHTNTHIPTYIHTYKHTYTHTHTHTHPHTYTHAHTYTCTHMQTYNTHAHGTHTYPETLLLYIMSSDIITCLIV